MVKSFKTLSYEGSQAKITQDLQDNEYYNLSNKKGWYVESINTNIESGKNIEFIEKENKWFNYIKGAEAIAQDQDGTKEFSYQGVGVVRSSQIKII